MRVLEVLKDSRFWMAFCCVCLACVCIAVTVTTAFQRAEIAEIQSQKEIVRYKHVVGLEVNAELQALMEAGHAEKVYSWYDRYTYNRRVTIALVNSALLHGIPVHLSLAHAWQESRFVHNAIGKNMNSSGVVTSRDFGLKQLNEFTFKYCSYADMLNIEYNIAMADAFLVDLYKKYKSQDNTFGWDRALLAYNRGWRIDERGLKYVQNIRTFEEKIDNDYNTNFLNYEIEYEEVLDGRNS